MKKQVKVCVLAGMLLVGMVFPSMVIASEWRAKAVSEIEIVDGQKEYTLKWGDTLWAIGQKINIRYERLAEINGIDLSAGEEYRLPVGRTISIDGNVVTVKEKDGSVYSKSVITPEQKIDETKEVGEPVAEQPAVPEVSEKPSDPKTEDLSAYPHAVAVNTLSDPMTFKFNGANVPDTVRLNFSEGTATIGMLGYTGQPAVIEPESEPVLIETVFSMSVSNVETRTIRIFSAGDNSVRSVQANTIVTLTGILSNPDNRDYGWSEGAKDMYLIVNQAGTVSLITPNYAGNVMEDQSDVMIEVLP